MVRLVIEVTGVPKWVTVEDLSGPTIKFDGLVREEEDVEVDIHSRDNEPGSVIVYAGRHRGSRSAQFHEENFKDPCTLTLSDDVVRLGGGDAANPPRCEWKNILDGMTADGSDAEQRAGAPDALTKEAGTAGAEGRRSSGRKT